MNNGIHSIYKQKHWAKAIVSAYRSPCWTPICRLSNPRKHQPRDLGWIGELENPWRHSVGSITCGLREYAAQAIHRTCQGLCEPCWCLARWLIGLWLVGWIVRTELLESATLSWRGGRVLEVRASRISTSLSAVRDCLGRWLPLAAAYSELPAPGLCLF